MLDSRMWSWWGEFIKEASGVGRGAEGRLETFFESFLFLSFLWCLLGFLDRQAYFKIYARNPTAMFCKSRCGGSGCFQG